MSSSEPPYDVALSFAGEQREFVDALAAVLRARGVRVFYDDYEKVSLWGKDLYEHLDYVYSRAARYCVMFVSADYARKVWTNHERKSAQARAFEQNEEYILPFRFDDTEVPGLRSTVGHLSSSDYNVDQLADAIVLKLGPRTRANYLPPYPTKLFAELGASAEAERDAVRSVAGSFYVSLSRMSIPERRLIGTVFAQGCPTEMPENMHIEIDLLRRELGLPVAEVVHLATGMSALGVEAEYIDRRTDGHDDGVIKISWNDTAIHERDSVAETYAFERSTEIAEAMLRVGLDHYCAECARARVEQLDFSDLAG